jgi:hypothetical protein
VSLRKWPASESFHLEDVSIVAAKVLPRDPFYPVAVTELIESWRVGTTSSSNRRAKDRGHSLLQFFVSIGNSPHSTKTLTRANQ